MRKNNKKRFVIPIVISTMMIATACGGSQVPETSEPHNETIETTMEMVETTEAVVDETTQAPTTIAKLNWETPVIELGKSYEVNEDVRTYIEASDESVYDEFIVTNDIDINNAGEYMIFVSGPDNYFEFPVEVRDSVYPTMTIAADYLIGMEDEIIPAQGVIVDHNDNDAEYRYGFLGFDYVSDFKNFDYYHMEETVPVYEQATMDYNTEFLNTITVPEKDGIYATKAVVVDRAGNAITCQIYIVVDNSGPEIFVAKEHVVLEQGEGYDFGKGLRCEDNLYPEDECGVWVDETVYNAMVSFLNTGMAGDTKCTYVAQDPLGNTTRKTITVTVKEKKQPQGNSGNNSGENSGQSGNNQGSNNDNVTQSASFDLGAAKEAFARINAYRKNAGLGELSWNDTLYEACKIRAKEIVSTWSHTRPDGSHCNTVRGEVGWNGTTGENIAKGTAPFSGNEVAEVWYNSDGHRQNILIPQYNYGAIACYVKDGWTYWVNIFSN